MGPQPASLEAALSATSRLRLPQASASLGRSAAWAALTGQIELGSTEAGHQPRPATPSDRQRSHGATQAPRPPRRRRQRQEHAPAAGSCARRRREKRQWQGSTGWQGTAASLAPRRPRAPRRRRAPFVGLKRTTGERKLATVKVWRIGTQPPVNERRPHTHPTEISAATSDKLNYSITQTEEGHPRVRAGSGPAFSRGGYYVSAAL